MTPREAGCPHRCDAAAREASRRSDGSHAELVDVTLLVIDDCPHPDAAAANLTAALAEARVGEAVATQGVIATARDASTWEFRGTPTVLLDGRDPFAGDAPRSFEVSCPVYRTPDGPADARACSGLSRLSAPTLADRDP